VNARGSWASKPATASTPTLTSTTRTRLRGQVRSSMPPQRCYEQCRAPRDAGSHRAGGRPAGRKLSVTHSPTRGCTRRRGRTGGANPRSMQVKQRSDPPTRDARQPRSGSSTRAGRWTATPATSSTPGARARWMRERRKATTLDGVDATTATKTVLRRRNPRGPVCSAGRSARQPSPNASASPRPSSSTTGRRIPRVAQRLPPGVPAGRGHQ
jgi:hypothetical protein